jgi:TetR/AcrR family transcriptional regulator
MLYIGDLWRHIMTNSTEQKILDASLKLFAKEGYKGATIKLISIESGFSELTVFRKFETKKNLFEQVLIHNLRKLKKEQDSLLNNLKSENTENLVKNLIMGMATVTYDNFDFIKIATYSRTESTEPIMIEINAALIQFVAKNIPNKKIDPRSLALDMLAFVYMYALNKHQLRRLKVDIEEVLEGYIKNTIQLIQS